MRPSIKLAEFQGASVSGSVPITEKVLNEFANLYLSERSGRIEQVDIQIGRDNWLQAGVRIKIGPFSKWFRPELVLEPPAQAHKLVLSIASPKYAGFLWIADLLAKERLPQGLTIQGARMILDFAAIPDTAPYIAHLQSLRITTQRGTIFLSFHLRINE